MQNFNFHTHTTRCGHADPTYTLSDIVRDSVAAGFSEMAFTDHAPRRGDRDRGVNVRMACAETGAYLADIRRLQTQYADKIRIFSGFEAEYVPGDEDFLRDLKRKTDCFVLGQHYIYTDAGEWKLFSGAKPFTDAELLRYAVYIEQACAAGLPDILAHPDEYLHTRPAFGDVEAEVAHRVCAAAERYDIPLEINLHRIYNTVFGIRANRALTVPERLDEVRCPNRSFWAIAAGYRVRVVFGLDVHYRGELSVWKTCADIARQRIGAETFAKLRFVKSVL